LQRQARPGLPRSPDGRPLLEDGLLHLGRPTADRHGRFRRQDADTAEKFYRKALEIDARQPEAQYNLGYVTLERGDPEGSIPLFLRAIQSDPKFADAYFNLAMAYEQVGESTKARPYWKNYIQLEPTGTWTEIAKRHL